MCLRTLNIKRIATEMNTILVLKEQCHTSTWCLKVCFHLVKPDILNSFLSLLEKNPIPADLG